MTIFCDGGCSGNPGGGGWAAIIVEDQLVREISGGMPATTNNQMELKAAIEALRILKEPCQVRLFTDSLYLRKGISIWLKRWKINGWKTRARKNVKNQDVWEELESEAAKHEITWEWVRGHSGDKMNDHCDSLAKAEIVKVRQQLTPDELKARLDE